MFRKDQAPAKTLDPGSTVSASAHSYYMTYPDGRQERLVHAFSLRYLFRFEVEHLLGAGGFSARTPLRRVRPEPLWLHVSRGPRVCGAACRDEKRLNHPLRWRRRQRSGQVTGHLGNEPENLVMLNLPVASSTTSAGAGQVVPWARQQEHGDRGRAGTWYLKSRWPAPRQPERIAAHDRGRCRAAHRVRERRQPPARAWIHAPT